MQETAVCHSHLLEVDLVQSLGTALVLTNLSSSIASQMFRSSLLHHIVRTEMKLKKERKNGTVKMTVTQP